MKNEIGKPKPKLGETLSEIVDWGLIVFFSLIVLGFVVYELNALHVINLF
jgi:hypothetical protein